MYRAKSSVIAFSEKSVISWKGRECVIAQGDGMWHPGLVFTAGWWNIKQKYTANITNDVRIIAIYGLHKP